MSVRHSCSVGVYAHICACIMVVGVHRSDGRELALYLCILDELDGLRPCPYRINSSFQNTFVRPHAFTDAFAGAFAERYLR